MMLNSHTNSRFVLSSSVAAIAKKTLSTPSMSALMALSGPANDPRLPKLLVEALKRLGTKLMVRCDDE